MPAFREFVGDGVLMACHPTRSGGGKAGGDRRGAGDRNHRRGARASRIQTMEKRSLWIREMRRDEHSVMERADSSQVRESMQEVVEAMREPAADMFPSSAANSFEADAL